MDRLRTGAQERDSFRLLGMQCAWEPPHAHVLRGLPARLSRRHQYGDAVTNLSTKSLFSLYPSAPQTSRKRTAPTRIADDLPRTGGLSGQQRDYAARSRSARGD